MFDSKECEWGDFSLYINGVFITKMSGLSFRKRQEKEFQHAWGNEPHSIQRGNVEYEGTLNLYKNALDALNRAVVTAGGATILDASFLIVADFAPKGTRLIQNHTLFGVEFTDMAFEIAQNAKSVSYALPFLFMKLKST